jgi:hypothetical protein
MWDLQKIRDEVLEASEEMTATFASLPVAATIMAKRVLDGDIIDQAGEKAEQVIEKYFDRGYEIAKENADKFLVAVDDLLSDIKTELPNTLELPEIYIELDNEQTQNLLDSADVVAELVGLAALIPHATLPAILLGSLIKVSRVGISRLNKENGVIIHIPKVRINPGSSLFASVTPR